MVNGCKPFINLTVGIMHRKERVRILLSNYLMSVLLHNWNAPDGCKGLCIKSHAFNQKMHKLKNITFSGCPILDRFVINAHPKMYASL